MWHVPNYYLSGLGARMRCKDCKSRRSISRGAVPSSQPSAIESDFIYDSFKPSSEVVARRRRDVRRRREKLDPVDDVPLFSKGCKWEAK